MTNEERFLLNSHQLAKTLVQIDQMMLGSRNEPTEEEYLKAEKQDKINQIKAQKEAQTQRNDLAFFETLDPSACCGVAVNEFGYCTECGEHDR